MKALVLRELGGKLEPEERPVPRAGPREVLVKVRACGVGLTLSWSRKGRTGAPTLPRIIGHEIAGDVVGTGPHVEVFRPGQRVAAYYYLTCGHCRWCDAGRDDLCDNFRGVIGRQIDGGLAEYVALPARNLALLPDRIGYAEAAVTTDAISTPLHVLRNRAGLKPPETVLVVGAGGGVGVHMVQMAKLLGAGRVIGVDIAADKLALAKANGADDVINARETPFDEEVSRLTGGRGVDVCAEIVGAKDTLARSLKSMGKGGRLVWVGSYEGDAALVIPQGGLLGEIAVMGSRYCTRRDMAEALDLVAAGRIKPSITRYCRLEEADAVLSAIERMEIAGRACVLFD